MKPNCLYYGDCLDWMREWKDDCVDLIYLDPPFNSNANYSVLFGTAGNGDAQYRAFNDTWHWDVAASVRFQKIKKSIRRPAHDAIVGLQHILGNCGMLAYLTYMAERLEEMQRILKPTGSIYLHCDPTASHSLKLLMDAIFGQTSFRNEIIWHYSKGNSPNKDFRRKHDTVFRYCNSEDYVFNQQRYPHLESQHYRFNKEDADGRKYRINYVKDKNGEYKRFYLDDGVPVDDVWSFLREGKFDQLPHNAKENLGYPTQKPEILLERIIKASSCEGDIVLDPFCGCGTAVVAASRLKRRWVGIDISSFAIDLVRKRMNDESIETAGIPADLASARKLAREKPFDFESWAIMRLPGFVPNTKQVADGGIDGRGKLYDKPDNRDSDLALAQVKGGKFNIKDLRAFVSVVDNSEAAIGCYITMDPITSRAARTLATAQETVTVRGQSYNRMNLWSIADYFDNRPCILPPMADPYTGDRIEGALF